jgi:hypothetical protein
MPCIPEFEQRICALAHITEYFNPRLHYFTQLRKFSSQIDLIFSNSLPNGDPAYTQCPGSFRLIALETAQGIDQVFTLFLPGGCAGSGI